MFGKVWASVVNYFVPPKEAKTSIPPGTQTIEVQFKEFVMAEVGTPLTEMLEMMENLPKKKTQAEEFRRKIKDDHMLPLTVETWKALGAKNIVLSYQPSGNYKVTVVDFNDGSSWEKG